MSRISTVFEGLKEAGRGGLIPFVTAGDPSAEVTLEVMDALVAGGADIIELGIPYSDPMADGPVIQAASERSIAAGTSVATVLDLVRRFRVRHQVPVVLFGYYNPIFQYGEERFARDASDAGADGCLVVDLPPEEAGPFTTRLNAAGMDFIALLTPTSGPERIAAVKGVASGFVYYVSLKGVTGADAKGAYDELGPRVAELREALNLPVGVGFGISTAEDVRAVTRHAEAAVVGSALIREMAPQNGEGAEVASRAQQYMMNLRQGL